MGVKVNRNAPCVLDLQAIWIICTRLDFKDKRPAGPTLKAKLVTEFVAVESEKRLVFDDWKGPVFSQFSEFRLENCMALPQMLPSTHLFEHVKLEDGDRAATRRASSLLGQPIYEFRSHGACSKVLHASASAMLTTVRVEALHTTPSTMLPMARVEASVVTELHWGSLMDMAQPCRMVFLEAPLDCTTPHSKGSTWSGPPKHGKVAVEPGFIDLKLTRRDAQGFPINVVVRRWHMPKQVCKALQAKTSASVMRAVRVEAEACVAELHWRSLTDTAPLDCTTPHSKGSTWSVLPKHGKVAVEPGFIDLKLTRLYAQGFPINVVVRRWHMPKQVCKALQAKTSASVMRAVRVEALWKFPISGARGWQQMETLKASVTELHWGSLTDIAPLDCTTPHSKGSTWSGLPKHGKVSVEPSFIDLKLTRRDARARLGNASTGLVAKTSASVMRAVRVEVLHASASAMLTAVRVEVLHASASAMLTAVRVEALHTTPSTMLTMARACVAELHWGSLTDIAPLDCTTPHSKGSTWSGPPKQGKVAVEPGFIDLKLTRLYAQGFPINDVVRSWHMPKQVCMALQAKTSASVMRAVRVEAPQMSHDGSFILRYPSVGRMWTERPFQKACVTKLHWRSLTEEACLNSMDMWALSDFFKRSTHSSLPKFCKDLWKFPIIAHSGWKVDHVQNLPPLAHKPKLTSLSFKVDVKVEPLCILGQPFMPELRKALEAKTSASAIWRAIKVAVTLQVACLTEVQVETLMYMPFLAALSNTWSSLPKLCKELPKFPFIGTARQRIPEPCKELSSSAVTRWLPEPCKELPKFPFSGKACRQPFMALKAKTSASAILRAVEVEACITEVQVETLMDTPFLAALSEFFKRSTQSSLPKFCKAKTSASVIWRAVKVEVADKISIASKRLKVDPVQNLPPLVHKPKLASLSFQVDVKDLSDQNKNSSSSPWRDISTWSRRPELCKAKVVSDESLVCGACRLGVLAGQRDSFFLNDIWSPTLVAGEEVRGEKTSNYHQVNGLAQQSDLQIGCRTILARCKKRFSLMNYKRPGGQTAQSGRPAPAKDGCNVLKATVKEGPKVVLFSGAANILNNTDASLPGMDLLGRQHKFIQPLLIGEKMALPQPFVSQLLATGMLLEDAEPSELILASISHGGNPCHAVTSYIERATGEPVCGVVMWDFMSPAFKDLGGTDEMFPDTLDERIMFEPCPFSTVIFLKSHVPNYRCRSSSIQIRSAFGTGEELLQILERESYDAALGLYYERHKTHKVHAGHWAYQMESTWDILRLIMSVPS